jgi:primary-amine oxidase
VTRYSPEERYPAGEYVNQNPGDDGLPSWVKADRGLEGEDIVVWHTFGPMHIPRVEDWPVMPVDVARFTLKPYGFFDKNPGLNVPEPEEHCMVHDHPAGKGDAGAGPA